MKTTNQIKTTFSALMLMFIFSMSASAFSSISNSNDLTDKALAHTTLGMEYKTSPNSPIGIELTNVYNESVAQLLGLKKKDILIGIGNQPITLDNFNQVLKTQSAGENITLRVERNKEMVVLQTTMPAIYKKSASAAFLGIETGKSGKDNVIGTEVMSVLKDSRAKEAGIKKGDIILGLDNTPIVANNLSEVMAQYNAGDIVTIRIQRDNESILIKTVLCKKVESEVGSSRVFTRL